MGARCWLAGGGGGGCGLPSSPGTGSKGERRWPSSARLRRRADFQRVYRSGQRFNSHLFTAFALFAYGPAARVGFTAPRALGKAVLRNRLRRRLRETVRLHYPELAPGWELVFNPRHAALDASFTQLEGEVMRFFESLKR